MEFHTYIRAVGTGVKGNRDLTLDESCDMMSQILEQKVYPEQISAFLLGWRLKPETITEFQGALKALDECATKKQIENSLELGYPFDGKVKNPYLFPLIAKELQKTDLQLVIPSDEVIPPKNGVSIKDIYAQIDIAKNCHLFDRKEYCNKLHSLNPIRKKLGLRTALSTLEKLPHVAQSTTAITGVFHKPYVKKYIEIFSKRYERFALIQGNEGTPELFSKGRLWITQNDQTAEHIIDPKNYGIDYEKSWEAISLQESLDQVKQPSEELIKLARLNAAIYLFVANKTKSVDDGYEMLTAKS